MLSFPSNIPSNITFTVRPCLITSFTIAISVRAFPLSYSIPLYNNLLMSRTMYLFMLLPSHHGTDSQMAQWWKIHLPMQETQEMQVWSLGQEKPLNSEMTTHSSILARKIPWTEEPGWLQSIVLQRAGHKCWKELDMTVTKSRTRQSTHATQDHSTVYSCMSI